MVNTPFLRTGGCLCGVVRYHVKGAPLSTIYCHCTSYRKHTGAPAVALAGFRKDQVSYQKGSPQVPGSPHHLLA